VVLLENCDILVCAKSGVLKLLGLDRIPQVEYFRKKIKQITDQHLCDSAQDFLFTLWSEKMSDLFFYIDGHVRVYSGK